MTSRGGNASDPGALEAAARELEQIASELADVANSFSVYHSKIGPLAGGLRELVGGSSTGKDAQIEQWLTGAASDVKAGADGAKQASDRARAAAQHAAAEATRERQEQAKQQRSQSSGDRCRNSK